MSEHRHEELPEGEERAPPGVKTMAAVRWVLVGAMALAAVAGVLHAFGVFERAGYSASATLYHCPMHPAVIQDHPGECPICGMTLVPVAQVAPDGGSQGRPSGAAAQGAYYCPMHPEVTSDDPQATCSQCGGMKLLPRPKADSGDGGVPGLAAIDLGPERVQLMGMKTAEVKREPLSPELQTVGYVTPDERLQAQVHTRFAGWVEQLAAAETGQRVSKGQVLATLYSPELLAAQQELLNALRWSQGQAPADGGMDHGGGSERLVEDARNRLELLGISPEEIGKIERSGKPMRAVPIRSPVAGYVIRKNVQQGVFVDPGTVLFEVADLNTVWVLAAVYEFDVARVKLGQSATFTSGALPGKTFQGKVRFIHPALDPATRTLQIRLELPNPKLELRPGLYGDAVVQLGGEVGLVVPRDAVVDTGEAQYIFLSLPGGRFEPRAVKVGARAGERIQILEGVSEGDQVVTTANFLLDSESRLRAAIEGQTAPAPASADGGPAASQHGGHR
jgi:Cu(I)/Ag(I) efflux system membrane fusion protein